MHISTVTGGKAGSHFRRWSNIVWGRALRKNATSLKATKDIIHHFLISFSISLQNGDEVECKHCRKSRNDEFQGTCLNYVNNSQYLVYTSWCLLFVILFQEKVTCLSCCPLFPISPTNSSLQIIQHFSLWQLEQINNPQERQWLCLLNVLNKVLQTEQPRGYWAADNRPFNFDR